MFSWAVAGVVIFGLSSLRYPQDFSLILVPLYLLFWTRLHDNPRAWFKYGAVAAAVVIGLLSYHLSTDRQHGNPYAQVAAYTATHVPHNAIMVADEQIGDLPPQRFCREQQATACLHRVTYAITWDTYLQKTQKLGDAAFQQEFAGATRLYSASGFSGTATLWRLAGAPTIATGPARPLVGVDIAANQDYSYDQTASNGRAVLGYIHTTLEATAAGIIWDLCSPAFDTDSVVACPESLSVADVGLLIKEAQADHLAVQLRPLIRVGSPAGWNDPARSWEGHIHPSSGQTFAASLLAAERPYLKLAKTDHAAQFVVGSELVGWHSARWQNWLLGQARSLCGCEVSFSLSTARIAELPSVKGAAGLDYYPIADVPDTASQATVTAQLEKPLAKFSREPLSRLTLDEVSIAGESGAYEHASNWNAGGVLDPRVQARWFTGMCQAAVKYHLVGLFFYEIPLSDSITHPDSFPAFFVDTPGAEAIRNCG